MRAMPLTAADREPRCETARRLVAPRLRPAMETPDEQPLADLTSGDRERLHAFEQWSPEAQQRALDLIRAREANPWKPFYCTREPCNGEPHDQWEWQHARTDQHPPPFTDTDWLVWLMLGGRGGGKTRGGAELTHRVTKIAPRIGLVAPTGPDLRDTMVEGVSGILATSPPGKMPLWEPSKKKLTWPNGAIAQGFSGEEPDRLRGPQHYFVWIDEPAHMPLIGGEYGIWDNIMFGLRLGRAPRICATTTPKATKWMKGLVKDTMTRTSKFTTYDNLANLAETFKRTVLNRYEGTRTGRQELNAEILEDVEGALWKADYITYITTEQMDLIQLDRIVVGIDPAGSKNKTSDLTGIVVVGIAASTLYVLADYTDKYSPSEWAHRAVAAYKEFSADALVAEKNYGGDMVREVLEKNGASDMRIIEVVSRRGKAIRAEPIVALYERERVMHVRGRLMELEDEQTSWVPASGMDSPNRLDALVHAATELAKIVMPSEMADPAQLNRKPANDNYIPARNSNVGPYAYGPPTSIQAGVLLGHR